MRNSFGCMRKKVNIYTLITGVITVCLFALNACASQSVPQCDGPGQWPASMAFVHLKNAEMISNEDIDFSKTKVKRIASEKIDETLHRQVHSVTFARKSGELIKVITIHSASMEECSMSNVEVYTAKKISNINRKLEK